MWVIKEMMILIVAVNNRIPLSFISWIGSSAWPFITLWKRPVEYKPNTEVGDIPPAADGSTTCTLCLNAWPAGSWFCFNSACMQPLNDKGRNEEVKDFSKTQKEAHFLQKYNRTFESLQKDQRNINDQHQRKRRHEEETEALLQTGRFTLRLQKQRGAILVISLAPNLRF